LNRALEIASGRGMPTGLASAAAATAITPATSKVALRALVIAIDDSDFGLPTWQTTLDRVGASYDVLLSRTTPLTVDTLVGPDGVGRYDAILLTNANQLYDDNGSLVSGLDPTEWNTLWAYERDYSVRQAVLYGSYGTFPEDYCLQGVSEGGVLDTA